MSPWPLERYLDHAYSRKRIGPLHLHALSTLLDGPKNAQDILSELRVKLRQSSLALDLSLHELGIDPQEVNQQVDRWIRAGIAPTPERARALIVVTRLFSPFLHPDLSADSMFGLESAARFFQKPAGQPEALRQGLVNAGNVCEFQLHPGWPERLRAYLAEKLKE